MDTRDYSTCVVSIQTIQSIGPSITFCLMRLSVNEHVDRNKYNCENRYGYIVYG